MSCYIIATVLIDMRTGVTSSRGMQYSSNTSQYNTPFCSNNLGNLWLPFEREYRQQLVRLWFKKKTKKRVKISEYSTFVEQQFDGWLHSSKATSYELCMPSGSMVIVQVVQVANMQV